MNEQSALEVHVGDHAFMSIPNRKAEPHLEWTARYGNVTAARFVLAGIVESYEYLLGGSISTKEAIRRLRIMRRAWAQKSQHRSGVAVNSPTQGKDQ